MKISTLCFPIKDNKIYLSRKKHGLGAGFINGFGGKTEEGESIDSTAVREIREEAGIEVVEGDLEKAGIVDFYRDGQYTFECHVYTFSKWNGEFVETEEMEKALAYDLDSPPFGQMFPADRKWIPLICEGKKIRAKCYFNQDFSQELGFEYKPLEPTDELKTSH